jgi:phosphotransferase system HPr (HPr) family protein
MKLLTPSADSKMRLLVDPLGWHLRQVATLVKTSARFSSNIVVEGCGRVVSAKSVITVLGLIAETNEKIYITASGSDAQEAIRAISHECLGG